MELLQRPLHWYPSLLITLIGTLGFSISALSSEPNEKFDTQRNKSSEWIRYESVYPVMGTQFKLALYSRMDEGSIEVAVQDAWNRVESINSALSDYIPESELNRLSRSSGSGEWVELGFDLRSVLIQAQSISKLSDGAFDVTVGPLTKTWRRSSRRNELPDPEELKTLLESVDYEKIEWSSDDKSVRLNAPDMRLDLGGIAKGYAAEAALKTLEAHGISRALIDAGGDLVVGAPPPGELGWDVGLQSYSKGDTQPELHTDTDPLPIQQSLRLARGAVASSGDLFQFVEVNGVRYSHILNPKTGLGLTDEGRVNVIACSGTQADALASALSVMSPEAGLKLLESFPGAEAQIIRNTSQGVKIWISKGFQDFIVAPHVP